MAGGGDASLASPLDPPLPALTTMSLTTTPTRRFGFCMMRGRFCHSCFEITARTALAHFTLKTRAWFQKGVAVLTPKPLPGCATALFLRYLTQKTPSNFLLLHLWAAHWRN